MSSTFGGLGRAVLPRALAGAMHAGKNKQSITVEQFNVFAVDTQQTFILEAGKQAADGFQRQPKIVADIAARHAEVKLIGRKAASPEPV